MKNKFINIKLSNGQEVVIKKSRLSYVVYKRVGGVKGIGCLATKTKYVDGELITNQHEVIEQLDDYFGRTK